jgi:hypothetical protein
MVFQAMERIYEGDSFDLEEVKEAYCTRIRAVEAEKTRLEESLRDFKGMDRNLVLKEIKATEALLEQTNERLQELNAKKERIRVAHEIATTYLRRVQATIQDLLREIAEIPKDRKRKADSCFISAHLL